MVAGGLQRACSLQQQGEMNLAWDRNSCEIMRSLGLVPNFITNRCCCSGQTSSFDVKSQALQASESEHRGPVALPITGELCVSSEITVHTGGRGKGVRSFFPPVLKSVQTSLGSTVLPFACITKPVLMTVWQLGGLLMAQKFFACMDCQVTFRLGSLWLQGYFCGSFVAPVTQI